MGSCVPCTCAVLKCVQVCVCVSVHVSMREETDGLGGVGCRFQIRHPRSEFDVHIKLRSRWQPSVPQNLSVQTGRQAQTLDCDNGVALTQIAMTSHLKVYEAQVALIFFI